MMGGFGALNKRPATTCDKGWTVFRLFGTLVVADWVNMTNVTLYDQLARQRLHMFKKKKKETKAIYNVALLDAGWLGVRLDESGCSYNL